MGLLWLALCSAFPDSTPKSLACLYSLVAMRECQTLAQPRTFALRDDGDSSPVVAGFMHILGVICTITSETSYLFMIGDLAQ